MADPTKIVPYAQQRSANLQSAFDAAKLRMAAAQNTITTESGKLEAATKAFAALEEKIVAIRKKLSAIPTPADGDLLLAELEQAIIDSRAKQAEILNAKAELVTAQAAATAAEADLGAFSAQLASVAALLKSAESASTQRDAVIAALEGTLSTIAADAAKALDVTKPAGATFKKAKKRIEDDIPKPLLDRALKRRADETTHIANLIAAQQAAGVAANKERDKTGGLAITAAGSWAALLQAETNAAGFVTSAQSRFDQAMAKLAQVADATVAPLTQEQIDRLNAPDPLKTDREDAATEEQDVADLRQELEDRQKELDDAIVASKADPKDGPKRTAVTTATGKVNKAKQDLGVADAAYKAASAAIINAWEAAVPEPTWRLLNDYAEAVDTLKTMADPAAVSTALKNAEAAFVKAQLLADESADVWVDLTTEQAQRAAREESARQTSAARLFGALRGDN